MPVVADERWTEAPSWWDHADGPPEEWFGTRVADVLPPLDFDALAAELGFDFESVCADMGRELREDRFLLDVLAGLEPLPPRPWRATARPKQLPPDGDWLYWLLLAGRGFGKSLVGSNVLVEMALAEVGDYAAVGPTFSDARKIMTEGETGLLVALGDDLKQYNRGDFVLYLRNGSRIILASADAPDRLRGLNLRGAWLDEFASFNGARDLWDAVLLPALRKGRLPRTIITTTPRRGASVIKELLDRHEAGDGRVAITRGKTAENRDNLSPAWWQAMHDRYSGTTVGRQELDGELLDEVEGALWKKADIERGRLRPDQVPPLWSTAEGIDPAVSNTETSDETGILVLGIGPPPAGWRPPEGTTISSDAPHLYALADVSLRSHPVGWARVALTEADEWAVDTVAAERNQGGDLVETNLRLVAASEDLPVPRIELVWASVGKKARASPVAALSEQDRFHIVGALPKFEDELTGYDPVNSKESPNHLDAGVWAAVALMPELGIKSGEMVQFLAGEKGKDSPDSVLGMD